MKWQQIQSWSGFIAAYDNNAVDEFLEVISFLAAQCCRADHVDSREPTVTLTSDNSGPRGALLPIGKRHCLVNFKLITVASVLFANCTAALFIGSANLRNAAQRR